MRLLLVAFLWPALACTSNVDALEDDLFRDQVAPILEAHCIRCHHRDESKGDFSVEDEHSFFDAGHVKPGDSAASSLIDLITPSKGRQAEMPKTGKQLSEQQIDTIRRWIDEGAKWPDSVEIAYDPNAKPDADFQWWSLKPIKRTEIPEFGDEGSRRWVRSPIDAFVLRKLVDRGLRPAPEADRRTLIRRLYYDLTGLPPSFAEVTAFENDETTDAYEKLVDRLLESPRYGERWARHWLDVVKYADTCGYDKDKLRPNAWPYRDYVVRSFNQDKPYKQFVAEQVAGDALYPDKPDGILGLGFIASGPWDFIGHVEVPESKIDGLVARYLDRDDMVANTLNTFCSVTIQCARCHDHKFDPFTQQDYYGLQAVFAAVDRADRVFDIDPKNKAKRTTIQAEIDKLKLQLSGITNKITSAGGEKWKDLNRQIELAKKTTKRPEFGYHSSISDNPEVEKWFELSFETPQMISKIVLNPCHDDFNNIGAGFGFPVRFRVEVNGKVFWDKTDNDFPNPRLSPVSIPLAESVNKIRVVATKLARRKNDYHFALSEIQVIDVQGTNIASSAKISVLDSIEAPVRWRATNLVDGIWYQQNEDDLATLQQHRSELLVQLIGEAEIKRQMELQQQLEACRTELREIPAGKLVYAAATEFQVQGNFKPTGGTPREVNFLLRGDVTSPKHVVPPGVLPLAPQDSATMTLKSDAGEADRRAELARWLTCDSNPLTWRSIVNRVWHYHFARGIVDTPNDFGRMGGERSHPELLDWLAIEFRDGSEFMRPGSFKDLHRLIVTSSVYRQSSDYSSPASRQDTDNRLLWRMNRRRLSAEEIRDTILLASGSLNLEMGGPGYYLFALEKTEHSPHFEYHKFDHTDQDSYRRSIYRFIVRSQPDPFMTTLDCADSSQSTPVRNETQTPLQSLAMLNSDFNLVMASKLSERVGMQSDSHPEQIELAMQFLLGRNPDAAELSAMLDYLEKHGLDNLIRIMFNLSEFVFID